MLVGHDSPLRFYYGGRYPINLFIVFVSHRRSIFLLIFIRYEYTFTSMFLIDLLPFTIIVAS